MHRECDIIHKFAIQTSIGYIIVQELRNGFIQTTNSIEANLSQSLRCILVGKMQVTSPIQIQIFDTKTKRHLLSVTFRQGMCFLLFVI